MRQVGVVVAAALFLGAAFSGCIGADDKGGDGVPVAPTTGLGSVKPPGQQAQLGWIYGTVSDLQTGAALKDVNVSLNQGLGSALTNATGVFFVINVPRGEYILTAKAPTGYLLSRYAISVFPDQGTEMNFKLQPTSAVGVTNLTPVVFTQHYFKETSGADYTTTPGVISLEKPDGEPATNQAGHPGTKGYGTTTLPSAELGGRPAARMMWDLKVTEPLTLHGDTDAPVEFPDPSYPGGDTTLVRYSAMKIKMWKWRPQAELTFLDSIRIEDVAPDGSTELLSLRSEFRDGGGPDGQPILIEYAMPFLKRGKEFHTFQPGHTLRVTFDDSNAWWVVYYFDGGEYDAGIDLRKGPFLEPPKAGDRLVLTFKGHTKAGSSNPYGIAWAVEVPPEADPVINPIGIHRTGAGGYYVGTACPQGQADCVGDTTVFFDVPQGAQTVYTRLLFTEPPVRDSTAMMNDYDILLYEPSGKAHTHTAGYGANQAELQFHDVFETPEWPQKWWVEIFAFLVVESDWTCTVEIQF